MPKIYPWRKYAEQIKKIYGCNSYDELQLGLTKFFDELKKKGEIPENALDNVLYNAVDMFARRHGWRKPHHQIQAPYRKWDAECIARFTERYLAGATKEELMQEFPDLKTGSIVDHAVQHLIPPEIRKKRVRRSPTEKAQPVEKSARKKNKVELTALEQKVVDILTTNPRSIKDLSRDLDKSAAGIIEVVQSLRDKGIFIVKNEGILYFGKETVELSSEELVVKDFEVKVGFIADTMLGSKSEQPTNLCCAFQIAEHEGVDFMIHLGVSAGKPTKMKSDEFHKLTVDEQIGYIVRNYPRSTRFKTRLISGYHDMQWRKDGRNILAEICMQREDLIYRGDWQADFPLRRGPEKGVRWPILKAAYHGGDNSPYSKSYPIQGFAENLIQDVRGLFSEDKPDIVVIAGQGIFCDLSGSVIRELVSVPGLRTVPASIMRKKRRSVVPTIGLTILTIRFTKNGEFSVEKAVYPLSAVKNDYRERLSDQALSTMSLTPDEKKVLELLDRSPMSMGELTQKMDRSDESIKKMIARLQEFGFDIQEPDDPENPSKNYKLRRISRSRFDTPSIDFKAYFHTTVRRGAVSDTHIGHNSELLEIIHEAYDEFAARKIDSVYHLGDITNGPPKHQEHYNAEVREFRATSLTNDVIALYPQRKGITTYAISGDHDRWFMDNVGYDLLDPISKVRQDIKHLGIQEGERHDDEKIITLLRHFNWGTGYAKSYKSQQVAEGLLKEIEKGILMYRGKIIYVLSGGGHVYCSMLYKGIVFIMVPCLQGKTRFITGLGKLSDVGFVVYSITYNESGLLTRFSVRYFDRGAKALSLIRKDANVRKKELEDALVRPKK